MCQTEILYKFLPPQYALQALQEHRLKVSILNDLNDIYDCAPISGPMPSDLAHHGRWVPDALLKTWRATYGLLSFSRDCSSPLLWGHYAANATGLALGFDPQRLNRGLRIEVKYRPDRPVLKIPTEPAVAPEMTLERLQTAFGVKAEAWEYEKEVRYLVYLGKDCKPCSGRYYADFFLLDLKEVVLGYWCSFTSEYIRHTLQEYYPGAPVTVYTSKMHDELFEVVREPAWTPIPRATLSSATRPA
jgi:hypothetical protein